MKILLTFTGFHDPFAESVVVGEKEAGPVLTVTAEKQFDRVCLFATPSTAEISAETKGELEKRNSKLAVEIRDVPLKDPTNYLGILKQLRTHFKEITTRNTRSAYLPARLTCTPVG